MSSAQLKKVSLVTPIYNEASHLQEFLQIIDELSLPLEKELVFIDDFSDDGSYEILKKYNFKSNTIIARNDKNEGKGAALHLGIAKSSGDIIGIQDADFEYSTEDIEALLVPLIEDKADVVYGSRFNSSAPQVHRTAHFLINKLLTTISNILSGLYLTDMETCYKFFRADVIQNLVLKSKRFGFEPEVTAKISSLKLRVFELSINYYPRNYLQGKKITWKDGIAAIWHLFYFNLLANKKDFIKSTMPKKYMATEKQWL